MANRTYDWNGHTNLPISYPDLSDFHMAGKVRMLMRSDLDHEGVVCGARDRIMCLSKERANLVVAFNEMARCLSEGKAFVFDPATNFCHADDGGAPEHGIRYAPVEPTGWEGKEKLGVEEAWTILCETPDITSPEEYPDHALITMEQLADFMRRAASIGTKGVSE